MAIEIIELRVGNLFWDEDKTPCYFAGAWERLDGWIIRDSAGNTYKPTQIYPIELTPSLLEKCGFEKGEYGDREQWLGPWIERHNPYTKNRFGIMKDIFGFVYEGETFSVRLPHLHILQNLYYFTCQEELTIQL